MDLKISFLLAIICLTSLEAKKDTKKETVTFKEPVELKGKREAPLGHYGPPRSTNLVHLQPGSGSFSIGAGYSFGGGSSKHGYSSPSFGASNIHSFAAPSSHSFGGPSFHGFEGPSTHSFGGPSVHALNSINNNLHGPVSVVYTPSNSESSSHRYTSISGKIQNPNLQPTIGSLYTGHSQPQITYGVPHLGSIPSKPHSLYGAPQGFGGGSYRPSSLPSYAAGTHGLGAFASNGPLSKPLFVPASIHEGPSISYGPPSFGGHKESFLSGGSGSHGGHGLFSSGIPHSIKTSYPSFSSHGPSSGKYTSVGSSYKPFSKKPFKPSAFLGSSISSPSSSYGVPSFSHGPSSSYGPPSIISSSPIYLSAKNVEGFSHSPNIDAHSFGSFSGGSHGSPSLSGSYHLPSAGHAAPSESFSALHGNYESPSQTYGVPSFGHESSSSSGGYQLAYASHGIGAEGPSSSYGAPSSSYESSNYIAPASSYGVPSASNIDSGYSGVGHSLSFDGIGSGKLEIPSSHGPQSFVSSEPSSSYGVPSGSYSSPKESYSSPQNSFSSKSNGYDDSSSDTYGSPSEVNYKIQPNQEKYDTIKYSRSLPIDEKPKN